MKIVEICKIHLSESFSNVYFINRDLFLVWHFFHWWLGNNIKKMENKHNATTEHESKKLLNWNKNIKNLLFFKYIQIYVYRCAREIRYVCKIIILKVIEIKRRVLYFFHQYVFLLPILCGHACLHMCARMRIE